MDKTQELLEAALRSIRSIEALPEEARADAARALVTPLARDMGASPDDVDTVVDGLLRTAARNAPTEPEGPRPLTSVAEGLTRSEFTRIIEKIEDSPALARARAAGDVAAAHGEVFEGAVRDAAQEAGIDPDTIVADDYTTLWRASDTSARTTEAERFERFLPPREGEPVAEGGGRFITGGEDEEEGEAPEGPFPARPGEAAAHRESLLRFLSQEDADLVRIHDAQQQQGGLGAARQAYRAANLPMYAQSPLIDPQTGRPVIDPETGQPAMQTAGEPGNAAPSPIGVPQGYHVTQPLTRESVGRYGSADALERRATPRSARFDDAGQILATDGRPLLEVGPNGELRVRTDRDGNALQPMTSSTTTRGPMYSDGDELYWAGHSPEQIGPIQARLARAGLIGPEDSVTWGWWDQTTQEAYTMALGYANQRGTTWIDALDEMQQLQEAGIGDRMRQLRSQYEPDIEAYRPPDPAAVRNDVRTTIENYLQGHEAPTEALQALINDLQGWHREQYDAETAAVMAAFDAQLEGLVDPNMWIPEQYGGTPPPEPAMGGIPPEGPPEVDLGARLSEAVRTRLAPQRALLGQQETNVGTQQSVHASVQGLLARLRGGL